MFIPGTMLAGVMPGPIPIPGLSHARVHPWHHAHAKTHSWRHAHVHPRHHACWRHARTHTNSWRRHSHRRWHHAHPCRHHTRNSNISLRKAPRSTNPILSEASTITRRRTFFCTTWAILDWWVVDHMRLCPVSGLRKRLTPMSRLKLRSIPKPKLRSTIARHSTRAGHSAKAALLRMIVPITRLWLSTMLIASPIFRAGSSRRFLIDDWWRQG